MKKIKTLYIFIGAAVLLVVVSILDIYCIRTFWGQMDVIFFSVLTGVISGYFANWVFKRNSEEKRNELIRTRLKKYEGQYDVYHWRDLIKPDGCNYQVTIILDDQNAILKIHQVGTEEVHELTADVKMNEMTFNYGEGNYTHTRKRGNPIGKMQVYLVGDGTINVDKFYLDDPGQNPGFEKWQWRKK